MMKKLQLLTMACVFSIVSMNAQAPEEGPVQTAPTAENALFDFLFGFDIGSGGAIGADGQAGVLFFDNQYWVSEWASANIHILNAGGQFVETFTIPGLTGTRSFTTDGTNIYAGTASTQIFEIDPVSRTITNTINISTSSDAEARMCTYDETLDGGNGGFWIGDFGSAIASVDMNGDELSVIPAGDHGTVIYGGAIDNVSPGGPFLWIHDQSGVAPSRDFITQIDPVAGTATGVVYDYSADASSTEVLAGGLAISADVDPNVIALVGLCQCTPSNTIFAIELTENLGTSENSLSDFAIYPNPATGANINIETGIVGDMQVAIFDVLGKQVMNVTSDGSNINVSALSAGVYTVRVSQNNMTATKKLVVN